MKVLYRKLPLIIWSGVIIYGSSQGAISVTETKNIDVFIHKIAHLAEYAILYILFIYAFPAKGIQFATRSLIGLSFVFLFGLSDEIHQAFTPTRSPRISDVFVDFCGGVIGYIVVKFYLSYTKKE